jgi:hypothetical protein
VTARRDPLSHDTSIGFDTYALPHTAVTDPVGLRIVASHDYRVLQPRQITDPNGNLTLLTYTPLGMLASHVIRGKAGEGDQTRPSIQYAYDLTAVDARNQPVSVTTTRCIHHDTETDVAQPDRDKTIVSREYSDGFGRRLQTRTQGEGDHGRARVRGRGLARRPITARR